MLPGCAEDDLLNPDSLEDNAGCLAELVIDIVEVLASEIQRTNISSLPRP